MSSGHARATNAPSLGEGPEQGVTNGMMAALPLKQQSPMATQPANIQARPLANTVAGFDGVPLNPRVPPPSGDVARMLQCVIDGDPSLVKRITSTSEPTPS